MSKHNKSCPDCNHILDDLREKDEYVDFYCDTCKKSFGLHDLVNVKDDKFIKKSNHGWINAKERMPEKDGRYLVIEDHHGNWIGVSTMRLGKFDIRISHWQNLPELPHVLS